MGEQREAARKVMLLFGTGAETSSHDFSAEMRGTLFFPRTARICYTPVNTGLKRC
jgi:hypothetical protein